MQIHQEEGAGEEEEIEVIEEEAEMKEEEETIEEGEEEVATIKMAIVFITQHSRNNSREILTSTKSS